MIRCGSRVSAGGEHQVEINLEDLAGGGLRVEDGVVVAANREAGVLLGPDVVGRRLGALGDRGAPTVWVSESVTDSEPASDNLVAIVRRQVGVPELPQGGLSAVARVQSIELLAKGPTPEVGSQVVLVRRAGTQVRIRRILRELGTSTSLVDQVGDRIWGPVGRDIDETDHGGSSLDRVHPEDFAGVLDVFTQLQDRGSGHAEMQLRLRDLKDRETWREATVRISNLVNDPEVGGVVVNLDERGSASQVASIGHTGGSFLSIAEAAPVGIILSGRLGHSVHFNAGSRRLLPERGLRIGTIDWIETADPAFHEALRRQLRIGDRDDAVIGSDEQVSDVASFPTDRGGTRWLLVISTPRRVDDGRVIGFVTTLQDITAEIEAKRELEQAQQRLVHLATHDPLTGLPNRAYITGHVNRTPAPSSIAVLFCDLDGFKALNDEHGHGIGDRVLAVMADRVREVTRGEALAARIGGDEFVIVVEGDSIDAGGGQRATDGPRSTDDGVRARADRIAESLVKAIGEPLSVDGVDARITVSIGATLGAPGLSFEQLVREADQAMYAAKADGRSRVRWADPTR